MTHISENKVFYKGLPIHLKLNNELVSLTDLWKAHSKLSTKSPLEWAQLDTTQVLLRRFSKLNPSNDSFTNLNQQESKNQEIITEIPNILETSEDQQEVSLYGSPELAIAYARFLSPECYEWALSALIESETEHPKTGKQRQSKRKGQLSRRALLFSMGWAVPVVASVAQVPTSLPGKLAPAHGDAHGDGIDTKRDGSLTIHSDGRLPANHQDAHGDLPIGTHMDTTIPGGGPHFDHSSHADGHADS